MVSHELVRSLHILEQLRYAPDDHNRVKKLKDSRTRPELLIEDEIFV
jgi:hypothetical protein